MMLLVALCGCDAPAPAPEQAGPPVVTRAADRPAFGLYVLALSWAPSFCCGHPDKQECADLADAYAGTHLTLHGLWPNFTDDEQRGRATYPQFCGAYEHCAKHDPSCAPDPATIPDEMKTLGPGYVGDHDYLADHEWPKHGSCTGLSPHEYFRAALDAMKKVPTPAMLQASIGADLATSELAGAFGVRADSVLLSCDAKCRLSQVSFCLAHDEHGLPTTPIACPHNTTSSQYDNGCVTRGCDRIAIPEAGSCDTAPREKRHRVQNHGNGLRACNRPGQGPSCSADRECTEAGWNRCARSGCCTNQP